MNVCLEKKFKRKLNAQKTFDLPSYLQLTPLSPTKESIEKLADVNSCTFNSTHVSFKFKKNKENVIAPIPHQDELEDLISAINAPLSLDDLSNV